MQISERNVAGRKAVATFSFTPSTRGWPSSTPARLNGDTRPRPKRVSPWIWHCECKFGTGSSPQLLPCRLNLVESQLWNENNWRGKYIGVVPRRGKDDKVINFVIISVASLSYAKSLSESAVAIIISSILFGVGFASLWLVKCIIWICVKKATQLHVHM